MKIAKIINKFFSPAEAIIFGKDFSMFWRFGISRGFLVGLTALLAIVFPMLFFAVIASVGAKEISVEALMMLIPENLQNLNSSQSLYYILVNMLCPLLFIIIPIFGAAIPASVFFTGEKEQETALSLLAAPCNLKSFFKTKFLCALANSWVVTILSFIAVTIFFSVGSIYLSMPFFIQGFWYVEIFLLSPVLSAFTVLVVFMLSSNYRHIIESVMTCGYVALPFILIFIGQLAGLYELSWFVLLLAAIAIAIADFILYRIIVKKLKAEMLI